MTADASTRRNDPRPRTNARVLDLSGRAWEHPNPARLYRWVSGRNQLLATIAATPRPRRLGA